MYLWWVSRNFDPAVKREVRDSDEYVFTDDEAAVLGPSVKRLLAMIPGGAGASAAVAIGEQLSIVFVLMAYAERTAPLRADARNAAPARRMTPAVSRLRRTTSNGAEGSNDPAAGEPAGNVVGLPGPRLAEGVAGSQHFT